MSSLLGISSPKSDSEISLTLSKYPYPFKAALAINNDTDGMSWKAFREWHDFVNGNGETEYGTGLGLEVGDSFWHWSDNARFSLYHGNPDETPPRGPEYEYIAEMARAGWLDTLHGFGSWNKLYRLNRADIAAALEEQYKLGIRPPIYVNHGGGRHMAHNVGGPWGHYQEADLPDSETYCLDLLLQSGFRYFWTDSMYESEKFGDGFTWTDEAVRKKALKGYNAKRFLNGRTGKKETDAPIICPAFGVDTLEEVREIVFDNTMIPVTMRDGNKVLGIKRYRGEFPANSGSFAAQISGHRLDSLVANEGAVIVYQHFGVWKAMGSLEKDSRSWQASRTPLLDEHCQWAFRYLAERQTRGEIFITTTQRLLDFLRVRDGLAFEVTKKRGHVHVSAMTIDCAVYGPEPATADKLQGVTFRVSGKPRKITMSDASNRKVPLERHTVDEDTVVTVPWVRLVYHTKS